MQFIKRYIEKHVLDVAQTFKVLLVSGARQVGKTTLLEHISQTSTGLKHRLINLDQLETRTLAKNDPGLFLDQYPAPLIIDEVQYAPEILSYIKSIVDKSEAMGTYWLTGSQQFHMMDGVSESLAGRVGIVNLLGLSLAEKRNVPYISKPWSPEREYDARIKTLSVLEIFDNILQGSFPRLSQDNPPSLETFYESYIQTYIDRDVRDLIRVSSVASFERFIQVCAARTATMLNLSDLARDSDVSVGTAKEWLRLLQSAGQGSLLQPYYGNHIKRIVKAPKLYFIDTGLACHLTKWKDAETASRGAFAGQLFETFVITEIIKSYTHRGIKPNIYYYRTKEKVEVDVLIEENGKLMPVEIKLAARVNPDDLRGINSLKKQGLNIGRSAIIACVKDILTIEPGISILPPTAIS